MERRWLIGLVLLCACGVGTPTTPDPFLLVSNSSLILTRDAPEQTLTLRNFASDTSINWKLSPSSSVIELSQSAGSLSKSEAVTITITIDRTKAPSNTLIDETLKLSTSNGQKTIYLSYNLPGLGLNACGTFPDYLPGDTPTGSTETPPDTAFPDDEILVQFRGSSKQLQSANLSVLQGFTTLREGDVLRPTILKLPEGQTVKEALELLRAQNNVLYAEPNYYLHTLELAPLFVPNDPLYPQQWALTNFGVSEAWDELTLNRRVVVAVLDSGIDTEHEDLKSKLLPGCDFFNEDNDPRPTIVTNEGSHGTHVAGIAAAKGNNGLGISGVGFSDNIKVLPIKVTNEVGTGAKVSHLLDAMLWSAGIKLDGIVQNPNPADIISMSIGAPPDRLTNFLKSIETVSRYLTKQGVLLLAASGNDADTNLVYSPASDPNVMAVGSVNSDYRRSSFSNYAVSGPTVSVMAPGGFSDTEVCTGGSSGVLSTTLDNAYSCRSGTSMATPFVAGTAALLLSEEPTLTVTELRERLESTAYFDESFMDAREYGAGVICPDRALGAATQCGR